MIYQKMKNLSYKYPIIKKLLYPAIFVKRLYLKKKIYYENLILDNLSELLLNEPIIKAEEFLGCFLVDSKSDLFRRLVRQKNYEPILVKLTLKYLDKNRDAIDVGANVGFYTNLFAKSLNNRKVLAIEPTENSLKRLFRNIEINKIKEKVIVFKGAVLDYIGRGEIKTLNGKEEYSTIGAWQHPAIQNKSFISSEIKVSTVDSLVNSYNLEPGYMKIDVEGMEHLCS